MNHVESFNMHFCKKECMKCAGCKKVVVAGDFFEDEGKLWYNNAIVVCFFSLSLLLTRRTTASQAFGVRKVKRRR